MACFDHDLVEITVMQFTGHPLLVHQFVTVPWDFIPVPYCQLAHANGICNFHRLWNGMFGRVEGQYTTVILWTPTYGRAKAGQPARTYIQQLCKDTGCSPEDLPEAMNDGEKWRKRVRGIRAGGMR